MEIEIAMDRQLVAQHALIIYGYEKDPRYEEPANSIDHYVTKHRVDGEGRLLEGAPLTREMLHKICSLVIPSSRQWSTFPRRSSRILRAPLFSGGPRVFRGAFSLRKKQD